MWQLTLIFIVIIFQRLLILINDILITLLVLFLFSIPILIIVIFIAIAIVTVIAPPYTHTQKCTKRNTQTFLANILPL